MSLPPAQPPEQTLNLPPPFINIPNLPNLRDIGGLPSTLTSSSGAPLAVRKQLLYRSGDPSRISPTSLETLHKAHGLTTILDLRAAPEIERAGTLAAWERTLAATRGAVTRAWVPVFSADEYTPDVVAARFALYGAEDGPAGFARAYEAILEHGGASVRAVLQALAAPSGNAALVHCSAGKDRAGCVVAVVLGVLGVPDEHVADEYALTEKGMGSMKAYFVERIVEGGTFGSDEQAARVRAERMVSARKEAMVATLELLRRRWGSPEQYAKEVAGVDDALIAAVRSKVLIPATASHPVLVGSENRASL